MPAINEIQPTFGPNVTLAWIPVGEMRPSEKYQRGERKRSKIDWLVEHWLDERVGALIVNRVRNRIWIDDGGHRWEAASEKFGQDYELPCVVNDGLNAFAESGVFLGVNRDRTAVSKWDEFRVGLRGGQEPYVSIDATLQRYGLAAAQKAGETRVGAIQALLRVVANWRIDALDTTLGVLIAAFTRQTTTWDGDMIQAVARLVGLNRDVLDVDRLISVLAQYSVLQWRVRASDKPGGSESRSILMAKEIAEKYNRRLRENSRIKATR